MILYMFNKLDAQEWDISSEEAEESFCIRQKTNSVCLCGYKYIPSILY